MWKPLSAMLALVLLIVTVAGPVSGDQPCGWGNHPACPTPSPIPSDPNMAVTRMVGFETQAQAGEIPGGGILTGTASLSTAQARTGAASMRANPASGASGFLALDGFGNTWPHFGLYIASLPSLSRVIGGQTGANENNLALNSDGTISVRINTSVVGTSAALSTGVWYWIGWDKRTSNTGVRLQINGADAVSGTSGSSSAVTSIGLSGGEASAIDIYIDDVIVDDAGFLNPSRVGLAKPISDVSRTDWTNDAAGTTLWSANVNTPSTGIADTTSGSGVHQTRDATNGNDTYVVNLTTYATLGLTSNDKVLAVQPFAITGAPSATSPKAGSLTVSNPTITKASIGNFYEGTTIAGTFPTGWVRRELSVTTSPTITVANSPQVTVTQDTSSTRIAMISFLGMYVAWTPGALGSINTTLQAVARAANY